MFSASQAMSTELRMLAVCVLREEKSMEVKVGRRDIYTRVPEI